MEIDGYMDDRQAGRQADRLTGDCHMAVGFALVDHVHHFVGAGDEALGASLRTQSDRKFIM